MTQESPTLSMVCLQQMPVTKQRFVLTFKGFLITLETIHGSTWIIHVVATPLLLLLFFP